MRKRDFITKDFALYVVHYFASMQTWSKEDILAEIDRAIKKAEPEDAVCVVRCKNCKHMNLADESCEQCDDIHEECGVCMYSWNCVSFDDFCSYGERRSE